MASNHASQQACFQDGKMDSRKACFHVNKLSGHHDGKQAIRLASKQAD
jgi:hypothetical protein